VVVGATDEGVGLVESAVNIYLVLGIVSVNEDSEPFGHKPDLVTEVFDQDARVPLDLVKPRIHLPTHFFETPVDLFKALVDLFKALVNPSEALIEVLNEFLIHFTSGETEE